MIYLDFNATTPVDPDVLEAMLPYFTTEFANPSSPHGSGRHAADAVEAARAKVATLIDCVSSELVFTSGATEANNLALIGRARAAANRRRILIGATEHKAVLQVAEALRSDGVTVDVVPVNNMGQLDLEALESLLDSDVSVLSVMAANNEIGTLNPMPEIAELAHRHGVPVHSDATQWVGKLPLSALEWNLDILSMSAHKIYGPKGVGALMVRKDTDIAPLLFGGGHERGRRPGTLNVPAIIGLGAAADIAARRLAADAERMASLRDRLEELLRLANPTLTLNGHPDFRLPNTLNVRFPGAEADAVLTRAPQIAASSGSACTSAVPTPSHVLVATGLRSDEADECIRFSVGRSTTVEEIDTAAATISQAVSDVIDLTRSVSA